MSTTTAGDPGTTRIARGCIGAITALLLALTVPAAAQAFTWKGTCDQIGALVPADAAVVREYVPEDWPLYEAGGKLTLFVTGGACRNQYVNGAYIGSSDFGLVNVSSRHPDDPADTQHSYDVWWFNDDGRLAGAMREAGITTPHVPGLSGPTSASPGDLSVPWPLSPFTVRVTPAPLTAPPPPFAFTSSHWHVGARGRVLFTPEHTGFTTTSGIGVVEAPAGTPIARMIGGTRATGEGVLFKFDFDGTAEPR